MRSVRRMLGRPVRWWRGRSLPRLSARPSDARYADTIFCVGDSHVSLFGGRDVVQPVWPTPGLEIDPRFRCFNIGPALAYNLCRRGTATLSRERLFAALTFVPRESRLLLSFGEIDCRAHLLKSGLPVRDAVHSCVARYVSVIREVANSGYSVIVYNVPPTPPKAFADPKYPTVGSPAERMEATVLFNELLESACRAAGVGFLSTTPFFTDDRGAVREEWLMDPVHLSQKALGPTMAALGQLLHSAPSLRS